MFVPVFKAYEWVWQATRILKNEDEHKGTHVKKRLAGLIGAMRRHGHRLGKLTEGVRHFVKVSRSYWNGLFQCYEVESLPRTNNDLEQFFGSFRYHERRATGRKKTRESSVIRGRVRLIASTATRLRSYSGEDLSPSEVEDWRLLRKEIEEKTERRRQGLRFRTNPEQYLARLEARLIK